MTFAPPAPDTGAPSAAWRGLAVRYPYQAADAVGPVTLALNPGERVLLLGPSGSGKSTLLNALTGLVPEVVPAEVSGRAELFGRDVRERGPADWSDTVARLFQDAADTLCGMTVRDEIAFALENRNLPEPAILDAVASAMAMMDLPDTWRGRRVSTLSGGEKQLVALAATLAQRAPVFVADEPTAHLAPAASARLHDLFAGYRAGTLVVIDHRIDRLVEAIDRVVVLGSGGIVVADGPPRRIFRECRSELEALGVWLPLATRLDAALAAAGCPLAEAPLSVAGALDAIGPPPPAAVRAVRAFVDDRLPADEAPGGGEVAAGLEAADCAPFLGPVVLSGVTVSLRRGEAAALLGSNGAGKSTLAASLAGLLRPKAGRRYGPPGGMAFQNPENQFTGGTVRDEIASALPRGAPSKAVEAVLERWDLAALAGRHPFELSQGQKRRLALAALTATGRFPLVVLDEPTAGLDAAGAAMIAQAVRDLVARGHAVLLVTHEIDFAMSLCRRAIVLGEGRILADGPMRDVLADEALMARAGLAPPEIAPALAWLERHQRQECA